MSRMDDALEYLAREIVVTRDQALKDLSPAGDMVLDGLMSQGYARQTEHGYLLSQAGHRKLAAREAIEAAAEGPEPEKMR